MKDQLHSIVLNTDRDFYSSDIKNWLMICEFEFDTRVVVINCFEVVGIHPKDMGTQ